MRDFKPMLSATVDDFTKLQFPLLVSPKFDGIRAIVLNGVVLSRNLKPIPNKYVQKRFGIADLEGFDGELILGDPTHADAFRTTTSAVMTIEGEPDVSFYVFDLVAHLPYYARLKHIANAITKLKNKRVILVHQADVNSIADIESFEQTYVVKDGYEGLMLRTSGAMYKFGRSTVKEQGLMKLKRFADAEARVLEFEEQMHNANEAKTNNLGQKERSSKKAGMIGKGTLGALRVVGLNGPYKGVHFNIGTGFDDALRKEIWNNKDAWAFETVKYKYFPLGSKDAPRFPVFLGLRKD